MLIIQYSANPLHHESSPTCIGLVCGSHRGRLVGKSKDRSLAKQALANPVAHCYTPMFFSSIPLTDIGAGARTRPIRYDRFRFAGCSISRG